MQYNLGFGRVQIVPNGRGWVRMGAIGYKVAGGQKNKGSIHIYWYTAHVFGLMAGKFPPESHIHLVQA